MVSVDEQMKIIAKGAEEIIEKEELRKKLQKAGKEGRPLTVKLGLDPIGSRYPLRTCCCT